jgi:hypothetical protein
MLLFPELFWPMIKVNGFNSISPLSKNPLIRLMRKLFIVSPHSALGKSMYSHSIQLLGVISFRSNGQAGKLTAWPLFLRRSIAKSIPEVEHARQ